ncbi:MAG: DUF6522 family protein [Paracoccaceae bacterium]|jgi:hypothetical protein|nr:DUF6522 family protein [Paracoccaceae bacterium]
MTAPPDHVTIGPQGIVVPAEVLGAAFALPAADVPALMRAGTLTSRLEQGQGTDAGTYRLTFYHGAQALRLIVDTQGQILKRTRFPVTRRPAPARR